MKIRSLMYVLMGTFTIVACTNSDNEATTGDSSTDKISTDLTGRQAVQSRYL